KGIEPAARDHEPAGHGRDARQAAEEDVAPQHAPRQRQIFEGRGAAGPGPAGNPAEAGKSGARDHPARSPPPPTSPLPPATQQRERAPTGGGGGAEEGGRGGRGAGGRGGGGAAAPPPPAGQGEEEGG